MNPFRWWRERRIRRIQRELDAWRDVADAADDAREALQQLDTLRRSIEQRTQRSREPIWTAQSRGMN